MLGLVQTDGVGGLVAPVIGAHRTLCLLGFAVEVRLAQCDRQDAAAVDRHPLGQARTNRHRPVWIMGQRAFGSGGVTGGMLRTSCPLGAHVEADLREVAFDHRAVHQP